MKKSPKYRASTSASDKCQDCPSRIKSVFADLPSQQCARTDHVRERISFKDGEELPLKQGGKKGIYCIHDGHFRLEGGSRARIGTLRICGPGDLMGYPTSVHLPRNAFSLGDSHACFIPLETFLEFQRDSALLVNGIIKSLTDNLRVKDETIITLEVDSVRGRVVHMLLHLLNRFGAPCETGVVLNVRVDRKTLARLSGTVVESLSRVLTDLEDEGLIARRGRQIYVADLGKLEEISQRTGL